jgi:hypothetical protein
MEVGFKQQENKVVSYVYNALYPCSFLILVYIVDKI